MDSHTLKTLQPSQAGWFLLIVLTISLASIWTLTPALAGPTQPALTNSPGQQQQQQQQQESKSIFKRSFAGLGCLGVYDKAKFARLDRVCEECYTLYREPDIHSACRQDCFRNSVFTRCVDALLLSHEAKKFDEMVDELYGNLSEPVAIITKRLLESPNGAIPKPCCMNQLNYCELAKAVASNVVFDFRIDVTTMKTMTRNILSTLATLIDDLDIMTKFSLM